MSMDQTIPQIRYRRKVHGIAAAYLPWKPVAQIDWDSYSRVLETIWGSGLVPAVNMDTGFANLLSETQRIEVLRFASEQAQGRPFVAGCFVEGMPGDTIENYRRGIDRIASGGGMPILFQCSALVQQSSSDVLRSYERILSGGVDCLGFELGTMFAPFGAIYDLDVFRSLIAIPRLIGLKHSSLSRELEWQRLAVRDAVRPDFMVFTGNDLAIDMIQWGSDYLLGLAAFFPEAFAKRDAYWELGDRRFFALNDALQLLGGFAFRPPVPAYKHDAGMMLAMRGVIAWDAIHPLADSRPPSDRDFLAMVLERIQELMDASI